MAIMRLCVVGLFSVSLAFGDEKCLAPSNIGCFVDPYQSPVGSMRVLNFSAALSDGNMTVERCVMLCCSHGFGAGSLAGLENGGDCYCGRDFGPYDIPQDSSGCTQPCLGRAEETCGGTNRAQVFGITTCSTNSSTDGLSTSIAVDQSGAALKTCGASGCTKCPEVDTCCIGHLPDPYRVPGGYGCAPPGSANHSGCAGGGTFPGGCCCAPGPSLVSAGLPNVLIIGDSVSAGYIADVRSAMVTSANVQHGPDNAGGGNADGVGYGELCIPYFLRTPQSQLPAWDVIAFNFGLHDGAESNATYRSGLAKIADTILIAANASLLGRTKPAHVIYFQTTMPGGSHSVPGALSPSEKRVIELNDIAASVMSDRQISILDLHAVMEACGALCADCKPHCGPAGYKYLSDNGIVPVIRAALANATLVI